MQPLETLVEVGNAIWRGAPLNGEPMNGTETQGLNQVIPTEDESSNMDTNADM